MQLLKPFKVTLPTNLLNGKVVDWNLIGDAVMGWPDVKEIQREDGSFEKIVVPMYVVVWASTVREAIQPASSVYSNNELASLGLSEEFDYAEDAEEDEEEVYE